MTLSRDYASMAPRQSSLMHYRPQVADGRLLASLGPHSPIRWMRLIIPDGCHGCVICLCVCFVLSRHSSSSALLLQHGQHTLTMPLHLCMDISIVKCIYFPCCSSSCLPMPCGGVCARACSLTSSSLLKLVCAIHTLPLILTCLIPITCIYRVAPLVQVASILQGQHHTL